MNNKISFLLIIMLAGCVMPRKIVNPFESLYYQGNRYFEAQDYAAASEKYEEFLEASAKSSLATPAKLNLGMAYYHRGEFKKARETFKDLKIEDVELRAFLAAKISECETKLKIVAPQEALPGQTIIIKVTSAHMDDFDNLILEGTTDKEARVTIDGAKAQALPGNKFQASRSWKKGQPLDFEAKDEAGNQGALEYFPDSEPPAEPEGLRLVNKTTNSVEVEWDPNTEDDIKGYKLYWRLAGGDQQESPALIEDTNYEVVGLQNLATPTNTTFQFYLRAVDAMRNYSEPSDTLTETLP